MPAANIAPNAKIDAPSIAILAKLSSLFASGTSPSEIFNVSVVSSPSPSLPASGVPSSSIATTSAPPPSAAPCAPPPSPFPAPPVATNVVA